MFDERYHVHRRNSGWMEVICGCMFSGKTEELIRRLNRALIAKQRVGIFHPAVDKRYVGERIVSHAQREIRSQPVGQPSEILAQAQSYDVIGIDEAQFFDASIVSVSNKLANSGKRVIIAGLDMDFEGNPFGPMPQLLAVAEFVSKVHAICAQTGDLASYSYRITDDKSQIVLGEQEAYEARSRSAFFQM